MLSNRESLRNVARSTVTLVALLSVLACGGRSWALGESWTWASATPRYMPSAGVVFENRIWLLGGHVNESQYENCIYKSSDGIAWTTVTQWASWRPPLGRPSVVFDNKIWILGGPLNSVYCSGDGVDWTTATTHAPWGERSSHPAVVYQNKMWVMGGYGDDSPYPSHRMNDVYCSVDGSQWTTVTQSAAWGPRSSMAAVVFHDRMFLLGGAINATSQTKEVWSSTDGAEWTREPDPAWGARSKFAALVWDDKIWVMGGTVGITDRFQDLTCNDVWYSADGKAWNRATEHAQWAARTELVGVVFKDRMWVMGGYVDFQLFNDVWFSDPHTRVGDWRMY